jgi:hypothetical protein
MAITLLSSVLAAILMGLQVVPMVVQSPRDTQVNTGDGSGLLVTIPDAFYRTEVLSASPANTPLACVAPLYPAQAQSNAANTLFPAHFHALRLYCARSS